jgi:hypothetical protein
MLIDEIYAIAQDRPNIHRNIANARQAILDIFYFTYGNFDLDLPTEALDPKTFRDIPYDRNPKSDILSLEAGALVRIFVFEHNVHLDRKKRINILRQILKCATQREREFLLHAITHRSIPGIWREDIARVFGDEWFEPRRPQPAPSMPKVATRVADTREEYQAFKPLKSLGFVQ